MLRLDGASLTIEGLVEAARGARLAVAEAGRDRMKASRELVDRAIQEGRPIYGVTTGLGARAVEPLDAASLADFSVQAVRGRAHAVGPPAASEIVRAALVYRLNTFLQGHSGARVDVADHLLAVLNAGLVPVVGQTGSIGASDLVLNATAALRPNFVPFFKTARYRFPNSS